MWILIGAGYIVLLLSLKLAFHWILIHAVAVDVDEVHCDGHFTVCSK